MFASSTFTKRKFASEGYIFEIKEIKSKGYSFFMETIYQLHKSGNFIKEVPIVFSDRKKGISKIPKIETFRTLKNLILLKIK